MEFKLNQSRLYRTIDKTEYTVDQVIQFGIEFMD